MVKSALVLLGVVIAVVLLVRLLEPRFAFFPLTGETATPQQFGVDYEALSIETVDGVRLHAWLLQAASSPVEAGRPAETQQGPDPSGPRAHVLYFHGNGGNLSVWAPILTDVARHGYSVLAFDYRGYGNSSGRPTERGLYRDVDAVLARFWASSPSTAPVIYWGRSLGAAMAAYAATVRPPDGVILESAFPDVRSLFGSGLTLFASYRFPTAAFMERAGTRTLVLHGDSDSIIPYQQGRSLFERIPEPKSFVTIRGGDHNDASPRDARTYWDAVNDFSAGL